MEPSREQAYRRRIAHLEAENTRLKAEVATLKAEVARLAALVVKLSKNSSKSPSSDIVKPSRAPSSKRRNPRKKKRKIDCFRNSDVLIEMPGKELNGVLGRDYFSAYRKYMREFGVELQFCLAHLIRDVKFLIGFPDERTRVYGERLLDDPRALFGIIHRRDTLTPLWRGC